MNTTWRPRQQNVKEKDFFPWNLEMHKNYLNILIGIFVLAFSFDFTLSREQRVVFKSDEISIYTADGNALTMIPCANIDTSFIFDENIKSVPVKKMYTNSYVASGLQVPQLNFQFMNGWNISMGKQVVTNNFTFELALGSIPSDAKSAQKVSFGKASDRYEFSSGPDEFQISAVYKTTLALFSQTDKPGIEPNKVYCFSDNTHDYWVYTKENEYFTMAVPKGTDIRSVGPSSSNIKYILIASGVSVVGLLVVFLISGAFSKNSKVEKKSKAGGSKKKHGKRGLPKKKSSTEKKASSKTKNVSRN